MNIAPEEESGPCLKYRAGTGEGKFRDQRKEATGPAGHPVMLWKEL